MRTFLGTVSLLSLSGIAALATYFGAMLLWDAFLPEPPPYRVPEASYSRAIFTENLDLVLATAERGKDPAYTYRVKIRLANEDNFLANFHNVALAKGWYASSVSKRYGINVVMPVSGIKELDAMGEDPALWMINAIEEGGDPRGPETTDLINVKLRVSTYENGSMPHVVGAILVFIFGGILTLVLLAFACAIFWEGITSGKREG